MTTIETNKNYHSQKTSIAAVFSAIFGILSFLTLAVLFVITQFGMISGCEGFAVFVPLFITVGVLSFLAILQSIMALIIIRNDSSRLKGYRYVIIGFVFAAAPFSITAYSLVSEVIANII